MTAEQNQIRQELKQIDCNMAYNQAIDDFRNELMNATSLPSEQRSTITLIATKLLK